jgi:hypothetical protein
MCPPLSVLSMEAVLVDVVIDANRKPVSTVVSRTSTMFHRFECRENRSDLLTEDLVSRTLLLCAFATTSISILGNRKANLIFDTLEVSEPKPRVEGRELLKIISFG